MAVGHAAREAAQTQRFATATAKAAGRCLRDLEFAVAPPRWAGLGFACAHLDCKQAVQFVDQRRVVERGLRQFGETHRRRTAAVSDPACGQQRAHHVEVLLEAHRVAMRMLAVVALGHRQVMVVRTVGRQVRLRQRTQTRRPRLVLRVDDRRAQPFVQHRVRPVQQLQCLAQIPAADIEFFRPHPSRPPPHASNPTRLRPRRTAPAGTPRSRRCWSSSDRSSRCK